MKKAYIIPIVAVLTFALGTASLMLPFLPFGWALYAVTALILMPYFKPLGKAYKWIMEKDKTGISQKMGEWVAQFYQWADENENAEKVEEMIEEASDGQTSIR